MRLVPDEIDNKLVSERPNSLEYWARIKPDGLAVSEGEVQLTWSDVNRQADALAASLSARDLAAGDVVAVRTQIRKEWIVINAALAKLDCMLLGTSWRLTSEEVRHLLADSGAAGFICDDEDPHALTNAFNGLAMKAKISIETPAPGFEWFEALLGGEAPPRFSRQETPLIIYTSGTTGKPKGVVIGPKRKGVSAQTALEYAASIAGAIPKTENDAILVTLPLSHGSGPAQIRRAVQTGTRIVLLRRFSPEAMLQLTARERITAWVVVPTMLNRLAALPAETIRRHDLSALRSVQVGAAPISPAVKEWFAAHIGRDLLHETYGSTETGMVSHLDPAAYMARPQSCGRPYRHVEISIRDERGHPLPPDQTGEIWVRTPVVIDGYFNAPPLPADVLDEKGFFRTGDGGRLDQEGYLFLTDRMKDMIIAGGVNIYPAEIEAALHRHPAVLEAAVVGIPHADLGEQVKAFVELKPGASAAPQELVDHCAALLAPYKVPRSISFVAELPRNITGKVLKRELRSPFWTDERQI